MDDMLHSHGMAMSLQALVAQLDHGQASECVCPPRALAGTRGEEREEC